MAVTLVLSSQPAADSDDSKMVTRMQQETLWSPAPSALRLPTDRVDIWRVRLDESAKSDSSTAILSADEIARASRFHFDKDRIHFIQCRSALRTLLGIYLRTPPAGIHFEYLASGKPQLVAAQNQCALQFNVSHSGNLALIAIGSEHKLGVDIEKMRPDVDTAALAERFFSVRERAELRALPDDLRAHGFFACWTRKEAFLKATGDGLSFPLADFSVTTHPDRAPQLEEIRGDLEAGKRWFLKDLNVGDSYRSAVAFDRPPRRLETYAWT